MSIQVDYYRVLRIRFGADRQAITASYKRLCMQFHPDLNPAPAAEEQMKLINVAYHTLKDDARRAAYDSAYLARRAAAPGGAQARPAGASPDDGRRASDATREAPGERENRRASLAMRAYFEALFAGEHEKAYQHLSLYDRQYVTQQSFCKWRASVSKLFSIREFTMGAGDAMPGFTLGGGSVVPARKFLITILEKNHRTQAAERYQFPKVAVCEQGVWRVFLGYRDLNEIAKMFEDLSAEKERGEMTRHWEAYCRETCRSLDMLSRHGLLKEARRELYRCRRYYQTLTVACLRVSVTGSRAPVEESSDALESSAASLTEFLRETDIPAYIGDGVFAVLFIELKRRVAPAILRRLAQHMVQNAKRERGLALTVSFAFDLYTDGPLDAYIDRLSGELRENG